jgi:hypothetical protein
MGLFNRIGKFFSSVPRGDEGAYWVYVRCRRCGEQLSSRIDLYNDLSVEYNGESDLTYLCRKTLVGGTGCFQRIEVELSFDKNRKMVDQQISGGEFIGANEYISDENMD